MNAISYETAQRMTKLCGSLQDELSEQIFWARLKFDIAPTMTGAIALGRFSKGINDKDIMRHADWKKDYEALLLSGKKVILYGTGDYGKRLAQLLLADGLDFYGFCTRGASRFPSGLMEKPVFDPQWLPEHAAEARVIVATVGYYEEVLDALEEKGFPMSSVLRWFDIFGGNNLHEQYFEFPKLLPGRGAFVDGGCFNGADSIRFATWCGGDYSRIFAFEPDPQNYLKCKAALESCGLKITLLETGLSDTAGEVEFAANARGDSFVVSEIARHSRPESVQKIRTVKLDDVLRDEKTAMIKMDIEGAEYSALHGAKEIIARDKPLLAICVYHKPGDVLTIMDYCKTLVPEYRFWLRHYGRMDDETVLYAAV